MPTPLTNDQWGYVSNCFVCEQSNTSGLRIPFELSDDRTEVAAKFTLGTDYSGAPALVHGGLSLAILDEAQAWAVVAIAGRWGLTRTTQTDFDGAVFVDQPHQVRSWILGVGPKRVETEAVIIDQGGVQVVRSQSSFTIVGVVDEAQRALGLTPAYQGLLAEGGS